MTRIHALNSNHSKVRFVGLVIDMLLNPKVSFDKGKSSLMFPPMKKSPINGCDAIDKK